MACKCAINMEAATPFPRYVSDHEIETGFPAVDDVAIVAADDAGRFVVVTDVPSIAIEIAPRQQPPLHLRGKLQVALESVSFPPAEMVQAEPYQRIGDEPAALDRVVTGLADAVGALLDSRQGAVDFFQQNLDAGRPVRLLNRVFQLVPPVQQLPAQEVGYACCHFYLRILLDAGACGKLGR